jgi:hypothetical protein
VGNYKRNRTKGEPLEYESSKTITRHRQSRVLPTSQCITLDPPLDPSKNSLDEYRLRASPPTPDPTEQSRHQAKNQDETNEKKKKKRNVMGLEQNPHDRKFPLEDIEA